MDKINFKQFSALMSAMLFIGDSFDKDEEIHEFYVDYKESEYEDPVEWAREFFQDFTPETHELYIRKTFKAKTYSELT